MCTLWLYLKPNTTGNKQGIIDYTETTIFCKGTYVCQTIAGAKVNGRLVS